MFSEKNRRDQFSRSFASSIGFRLPLLVIGTILVIMVATGATGSLLSRNQLQEVIQDHLSSLATMQAQQIERQLSLHANTMGSLALRERVQHQLRAANEVYTALTPQEVSDRLEGRNATWTAAYAADGAQSNNLNIVVVRNHNVSSHELIPERDSLLNNFGIYSEFLITDNYGAVVSTSRLPDKYTFVDEPWWQAVKENGNLYINGPVIDRQTNALSVIEFAQPIHDFETNELIGVMYSIYDYGAIKDLITQLQFSDTGRSLLIDQEGAFLYTPATLDQLNQTTIPIAQAVNSLYQFIGPRGTVFVITAVAVNSSIPAINALGWHIGAVQDRATALAPVNDAILPAAVIASSIGTVIVLLLYFFYIRPLTGDLDRLRLSAEALQQGLLQTQVTVNRSDELGVLGTVFNRMASQLRQTLEELEQRVATRTRALEVSADVSRRLSTILDRKELVTAVVEQIQSAFHYYHVHIYLLDETGQKLMMAGGTGEAGQAMLARGHNIPLGKGLVGRSAESKKAILVSDVTQNPNWLPNPLLPDTKTEVAVPITIGDRVLGVLDVQHNVIEGLQQADADLIQAIANQIANALQNAFSYERAQHQAEREALINTISQKLQSTTTVQSAMQIAVRELGRALQAEQTIVRLRDSNESITSNHESAASRSN